MNDKIVSASEIIGRIEESLFAMWDELPDLFTMTDQYGVMVRVSAACKTILGWDKSEMIGNHWALFIHPEDFAEAAKVAVDFRAGKGSVVGYTSRMRHKAGHFVRLYWYASANTLGSTRSFAVATVRPPNVAVPDLYTGK